MRWSSVIELLFYVIIIFLSIVYGQGTTTTTATTSSSAATTLYTTTEKECFLRDVLKTTIKLSMAKCTSNIEKLNIKNSKLDEIPEIIFRHFRHLKFVDLSSTQLWDIKPESFFSAKVLEVLKLNHNNFEILGNGVFKGAGTLLELEITDSQIITIQEYAFVTQHNLKKLDLSNNRITNLHHRVFDNLNSLEELRMDNNNLQILNGLLFFHCSKLSEFYVSSNNILDIDENIFQGTQIKIIDLANNPGLRRFDLNIMSLRHLEGIILTNCGLNELVISPKVIEIRANKNNIKKIRVVYDVDNRFPALKYLDLSENQLTNLTGFPDLQNLVELKLDDNQLHHFRPQDLTGLMYLKQLGLERNRFVWDFEAHDFVFNIPNLSEIRVTAMDSVLELQERMQRLLAKKILFIISSDTNPATLPSIILNKFLPKVSNKQNKNDDFYQPTNFLPLEEFPSSKMVTFPTNSEETSDKDNKAFKQIIDLSYKFSNLEKLVWQLKSNGRIDEVPKIEKKFDSLESFIYWIVPIISIVICIMITCMCYLHFDYVKAKYNRFIMHRWGSDVEIEVLSTNPIDLAELDELDEL